MPPIRQHSSKSDNAEGNIDCMKEAISSKDPMKNAVKRSLKGTVSKPVYFSKPQFQDGFLSQWATSKFIHEGKTYETCEMYMMEQKAILFGDDAIAEKILSQPDPKKNRRQGRRVKNFNANVWHDAKLKIVKNGNRLKFTKAENADELREKLLATGNRELVESASWDAEWGIGFSKTQAEANRQHWGQNLLGHILEEVREEVRDHDLETVKGFVKTVSKDS